MKKVLITFQNSYAKPFDYRPDIETQLVQDLTSTPPDPKETASIVFTGGEDISYFLYAQNKHSATGEPSLIRDILEIQWFSWALRYQIPMVGICRGAQFGCVMSGGKLYQHVVNHTGGLHTIRTHTGLTLQVTSTHHQMMDLTGMDSDNVQRLAWTFPKQDKGVRDYEMETAYFPKTRFLAVQFHPEYLDEDYECVKYFHNLLDQYTFIDQKHQAPAELI